MANTHWKLGFVGTGAITAAMVSGLSTALGGEGIIRLSPRNRVKADDLASRFANVSVAGCNQEVVDNSEVVVLAVKPDIAPTVIAELRFRPEHQVVSVVAGLPLRTLLGLVAPATQVTRAVPLPSIAVRMGPTAIYPRNASIAGLFDRVGVAVEVDTEEQFDALSVSTATIASYFALLESIASWLVQQGVPGATSRNYLARVFWGLTHTASTTPGHSFQSLADEHQTPGGINEQVLSYLRQHGVFDAVSEALDAVLKRVRSAAQ